MESTGIYWKSPYAALEKVGIAAWVVNVRHVKTVPGRKTDVADAQWLATLARTGLVRASFIPPADVRYLRLLARQRQKLGGMLALEKNRLHKLLADVGIRLNVYARRRLISSTSRLRFAQATLLRQLPARPWGVFFHVKSPAIELLAACVAAGRAVRDPLMGLSVRLRRYHYNSCKLFRHRGNQILQIGYPFRLLNTRENLIKYSGSLFLIDSVK
jgi:hypothetical protein